LNHFNSSETLADINTDGMVNVFDFNLLATQFTP
jgi:hypothetical protein